MEEITEKLKDILAAEGGKRVTNKDLAKELGIHPDTFNSMKFRNSVPYPQILNFLQKRNININFFFYGTSPKEQLECENTYRILKLYKANASLGGGGLNDSLESENLLMDTKLLSFFRTTECDLITCCGESMEPEIKDGSLCLVDRAKSFKNGAVYVINTREGLFIKQVFTKSDGVILHSLNPAYKDMFYKNGDFLIIGAVIGALSRINA